MSFESVGSCERVVEGIGVADDKGDLDDKGADGGAGGIDGGAGAEAVDDVDDDVEREGGVVNNLSDDTP